MVRSLASMYLLSKEMNFELIADWTKHPISKILCPCNHSFNDKVASLDKVVYVEMRNNIIEYLNEQFQQNDVVYMETFFDLTIYEKHLIQNDVIEFIQNVLKPSDYMEEIINREISNLPRLYNILHYRVGDENMLDGKQIYDFNYLEQHVLRHMYDNIVFITDSNDLKLRIKKYSFRNMICLDTDIGHVGLYINDQQLINTMLEFYICTRAFSIRSYCRYVRESGFVKIANAFFNVPLIHSPLY